MSKLSLPDGDDHPEAAGKHLADAEVLAAGGRHDGTAYLCGYVVECALKSLILLAGSAPRRSHDLGALSRNALRLAALPGARSHRYVPRGQSTSSIYDPIHGWRETLRYRPEGFADAVMAQEWLMEARRVYASTILTMRLDGVV